MNLDDPATIRLKKENLKIMRSTLTTPEKFSKKYTNFSGRACFAYDYSQYGSFENWEIALSILNNLPTENMLCNELIMNNVKVKPYFDIEYIENEYPKLDLDSLKMAIKDHLVYIFKEELNIIIEYHNVLFASCHRDIPNEGRKISFHVIINSKYVFDCAKDAKFIGKLLNKLLNEKTLSKVENSTGKDIVDLSVYKSKQMIRMVKHCKTKDIKSPFIIENGSPIDFCITNISEDYIVLQIEEQSDLLYNQIKNIQKIDLIHEPHIQDEINEKVLQYHPSAFSGRQDAKGFFQFNYSDRREKCFTSDDLNPRYHDKIGFFAYFTKENQLTLGCHSSRCCNNEDKKCIITVGSKGSNIKKEYKPVSLDEKNFDDITERDIRNAIYNSAYGMSTLFCKMYQNPNRIKWIDEGRNGTSYFWNGNKWECDERAFLEHLSVKTLVYVLRNMNNQLDSFDKTENPEIFSNITFTEEEIGLSKKIISKLNDGTLHSNILKFAKPIINDSEFSQKKDINPYLLSCKNGMVNLITGELRPAVPDDNITKTLETSYDVNADSSLFERFVREITSSEQGPDNDVYNYFKWLLGYALQGNPIEKKFIILYGPHGNNGKSLVMSTINNVLEHYSVTMDKSVILEGPKKTSGSHSTELAALENARYGILNDTSKDDSINDGQIKQITGVTDKLSIREIFGKQKEIQPVFVPFVSSNYAIKMNLTDKAMYERLIIIPFSLRFIPDPKASYERSIDNTLPEKLEKNKAGTLKWLVEASIYYHQNKTMPVPDRVRIEKEKYNIEVNMYLSFIENNFIKSSNEKHYVTKTDLIEMYKVYCKENDSKCSAKEAEKQFDEMLQFTKVDSKGKISIKGRTKVYTHIISKEEQQESDDELS